MYLAINEEREVYHPEIKILDTVPEHLRQLKDVLRHEDRQEMIAFGISPEKALWRSYKKSVMRKTAFIDNKIAAVWGVGGELMGNVGIPWLLTSDEVFKVSPLKFASIYQREVSEMLKIYPKLKNFVDAGYSAAIRLLQISGFTLGEPQPIPTTGALIRIFEKEI